MKKVDGKYFSEGSQAPIAVLGMHRSGTSCLTGLLQDAGVWLGKVATKGRFNKKGCREVGSIMDLHNRVLEDNGGTWNNPPPSPCIWNSQRLSELEMLISEFPSDRLWAFKDPRSCFTIGAWKSLIPDLRFIGTFRKPQSVASSLKFRGDRLDILAVDNEVALWQSYNEQLLSLYKKYRFPLICFDFDDASYLRQVKVAFGDLGLETDHVSEGFFESELRHEYSDSSFEISAEARELYQSLLDCTLVM